ncbi:hypothetical protein [Rhizobium tumorigenes]|uniref:Uncharacterized protein n=1 Tax=Rhizobium tumorigenes TaxID=2041385 RepID=A0AAF1K7J2_9HYPH|nr:hypothetical protein [Rhizobium tumorigenes]WFR94116.1 hypothetical protein PR017_09665 [Rhizobium tumorigenes]
MKPVRAPAWRAIHQKRQQTAPRDVSEPNSKLDGGHGLLLSAGLQIDTALSTTVGPTLLMAVTSLGKSNLATSMWQTIDNPFGRTLSPVS